MTFALLVLLGATDPATGFSIEAPLRTPCVYRPEPHLLDTCPPNHALERSDDPPWLYASDNEAHNTVVVSTLRVPRIAGASEHEVDELVAGIAHGAPHTIIQVDGLPVVRFTAPPPGPGWAPQEVALLPVEETLYVMQVSSMEASARPLFDQTLSTAKVPRKAVDAARKFNHDPGNRAFRNEITAAGMGTGLLAVVVAVVVLSRRKAADS